MLFSPIFLDFQNKAAGLGVNNSINKDVQWTFMVSYFNLKPYLSNTSGIFKIEATEAVLWLFKRVYLLGLTWYKKLQYRTVTFYIVVIRNKQKFISQILRVIVPREKSLTSVRSVDIWSDIRRDSDLELSKIKLHSVRASKEYLNEGNLIGGEKQQRFENLVQRISECTLTVHVSTELNKNIERPTWCIKRYWTILNKILGI